MRDLALSVDHDLDISRGDLRLIDGADQVRQQLAIKLKLWRGEWFLDTDFGTPYLQTILGRQLTLSGAITALRRAIKEVSGVQSITDFRYIYSNSERTLKVSFSAHTAYGKIEVSS